MRDSEVINVLSPRMLARISDTIRWVDSRRQNFGIHDKEFTKFGSRLIRLARTCTTADYPTYPTAPANCFCVEFGEPTFTETPGQQAVTFTAYDPQEARVACDPFGAYHEEGELVYVELHHDKWFISGAGIELVELCLSENHPGRGIVFHAYEGSWDSADNRHEYESAGETCTGLGSVHAIDWRYGVPYPDAGAKGLFIPRISVTYGTIYECVSLDCTSPGADCCTYETGP